MEMLSSPRHLNFIGKLLSSLKVFDDAAKHAFSMSLVKIMQLLCVIFVPFQRELAPTK
jgi:hypothetical protein